MSYTLYDLKMGVFRDRV